MKFLGAIFLATILSSQVMARCYQSGSNFSYCTGETVISDKGLRGEVTGVFQSGDVMVKFNGYRENNKWPTNRLAITNGCTRDNYCVNDVIISDTGIKGVIKGIFKSGDVSIKFNGFREYNKWPTRRLGVTENRCFNGSPFCVGKRVISDKGLSGVIVAHYENGDVSVKFNGFRENNKWPISRLAITNGCTRDDYCVSDVIISDTGIEGVVEGIFENGDVSIKFNGYREHNKWPTRRLAVTEACSEREVILFY